MDANACLASKAFIIQGYDEITREQAARTDDNRGYLKSTGVCSAIDLLASSGLRGCLCALSMNVQTASNSRVVLSRPNGCVWMRSNNAGSGVVSGAVRAAVEKGGHYEHSSYRGRKSICRKLQNS